MLRKRSASRKCLATRCSKLVEPPAVFCSDHWDQLPEALREAIAKAILRGQHDEAVTLVTEANRYLDNVNTPRRS
jgi:TRAP-type C4-dicarboxylate transport system substrate-binding protein